ncbi:YceK/YidQ family lipoprotein [Pseudomonas sp. RGM2987]|uniref:YceK/YidQ family lipoprotein n=1 Tax=Pseudomonas sp. RGM2987 TaxID=2930090 RepID=UPI001FD67E27|nr:YceK/YidQ family lipoprotein [Pseudomonas sp. RGM2987]MCJ8206258.1 YceK/YidQ family lipoprotein [Pseudomonas sp. RGM2987]
MKFFLASLAVVSLTGCSTLSETFDERPRCGPHPYCGSSSDIELIKAATDENAGIFRALVPLAVIDLPFSIVADTLFLPYTAFASDPARD